MGIDTSVKYKIIKEKLFERTIPEARWSCSRYPPNVPIRRVWRLKDKSAKL